MLSARQLNELEQFYAQEPFGDRRGDLHAALVASTVAGMAGKTMRSVPKLTDYVLFHAEPPKPMSTPQRMQAIRAVFLRAKAQREGQ